MRHAGVAGVMGVVGAAIAGVVVAEATTMWAGLAVAVVGVGGIALVGDRRRSARRLRFAARLSQWATGERPRAIPATDMGELHDLARLATGVGEAIDTSFATLRADRPWRQALVQALPTAAVLFNRAGYLVAVNEDARALLGVPTDGERTTVVAALGNAQLADAVTRTQPDSGLVVVDTEVGGRLVRAKITVVGDQRLVLIADRSRERLVEDVRRNFVVNASHELKTPATAIHTLSEALVLLAEEAQGDRIDGQRLATVAGRLEQQSERLVSLVRDLLDLRRLEDFDQAARARLGIAPLVHRSVDELRDAAAERGITFDLDIEEAVVHADPRDIELTLRNLLHNAVGYNVDGGTVRVAVRAGDPVEIRIEDTGVGIPRADLGRVFERFHRVDVARSRETGGTGLGLSMVRHAVSRNGGSVEVDSLLGSGSVFVVRLPRSAASLLAAQDAPGADTPDA